MKNYRRFATAVALRIGAVGSSLVVTVVLTRALGVSDFGSYAFALAVLTILAIPLDAGLPHLVVREVAAADRANQKDVVKGVLLRGLQLTLLVAPVPLAVYLVFRMVAPAQMAAIEGMDYLGIALAALPFVALVALFGAALRAFERYFVGQVLGILAIRIFHLAVLGLVILAAGFGALSGALALWAFVTANAIAAAIAGVALWRQAGYQWHDIVPTFRSRAWAASLLPLTLIAGLQIIVSKTDILMLRALRGPEDVGLYYVASQLGNLVFIAKAGVMMVIGPRMARLHSRGHTAAMQTELADAARFIVLAGLPVALGILVFGSTFIPWMFGAEFSGAFSAAAILAIGYLCMGLFGSVETLLKMTGHEGVILSTIVGAIVVNVSLNFALIGPYGPMGAALATAITMVLWRAFLTWRAWRILGVVSLAFYRVPRR